MSELVLYECESSIRRCRPMKHLILHAIGERSYDRTEIMNEPPIEWRKAMKTAGCCESGRFWPKLNGLNLLRIHTNVVCRDEETKLCQPGMYTCEMPQKSVPVEGSRRLNASVLSAHQESGCSKYIIEVYNNTLADEIMQHLIHNTH